MSVLLSLVAHQCRFGELPLVKDLTSADVENIIARVEELKQDNGMSGAVLLDSRRWIGLMLVAVGVFTAALLLSGGVAEAHGKHEPSVVSVEDQYHAEHSANDHQGHCHGGAFCSGPAIVQLSNLNADLLGCSERYGLPRATMGIPVVSNFDPPPPKALI